MSNYTKTTDFEAKDSLPSGDSGKIIRGSEFETEFDNIATAIATKADAASPTFTGTVTIDGLTVNGNTTLGNAATDTVTVTADIASNLIPSADDTYNLGASGAEWNDLFIDGTANIDSLVANTADINGGTIDGVTSVSLSSGNVTLPDNSKAIFGAGSDLQIYHDGSNSLIADAGAGLLRIQSNGTSVNIFDSANSQNMAAFNTGADARLFHNGSLKLATTSTGIDVTGTVTADGLTVDSSSGITVNGPTNQDGKLNLVAYAGVQDAEARIQAVRGNTSGTDSRLQFLTNNGTSLLTRVDINDNGDISFYEDSGTTPKLTWDASAESLNFADNGKAVFGAGSDLQIFHDTSHSFIKDAGTGHLKIQATNLKLQDVDGNNYIDCIDGSYVRLMHDANTKLETTSTGVDVTGTVTASSGASTFNSDSSANTVNFDGRSSDNISQLNFRPNGGASNYSQIQSRSTELFVKTIANIPMSLHTNNTERLGIANNGDISFYEDTGTTAKLLWSASNERLTVPTLTISDGSITTTAAAGDHTVFNSTGADADFRVRTGANTHSLYVQGNTGNVGIGTSNPSTPLHVSTSGENVATFASTDTGARIVITDGTDTGYVNVSSGKVSLGQTLGLSGNNLNVDASGNVGIGTPTPNYLLDVEGSGSLLRVNATSGNSIQQFSVADTTSIAGINFGDSGSSQSGQILYRHNGDSMAFSTAGSEAMRIDSSGNLLVGTTATNPQSSSSNSGVQIGDGFVFAGRVGEVAILNRQSTDGDIAVFRKDGTTAGAVAVKDDTSNPYIIVGKGSVGLQFAKDAANTESILPCRVDNQNLRDNAISLGDTGARFDDIYATNGTIQTSDRNEKQDIEALSDAEQRVAVAAKGLLRKFRWKSSVEENGDNARIHFGIIAQDLQAAFEAEGLDAGRYGMFINSTWTDEETGEERSRMGVRYSELLAFIIAAI